MGVFPGGSLNRFWGVTLGGSFSVLLGFFYQ